MVYQRRGAGCPLVFLHGATLGGSTYDRLLTGLSERFTVIAPDLPGCGFSDPLPRVWGVDDYVAYLSTFISSLELGTFCLAGHSLGGGICYRYAYLHPENVQLLILMSSSGTRFSVPWIPYLTRLGTILMTDFLTAHPLGTLNVIRDSLRSLTKRGLIDHIRSIRSCLYNVTPHSRKLEVPTLILWGSRDSVTPREGIALLAGSIRHPVIRELSGNHDVFFYSTDGAIREILRFYDTAVSGAATVSGLSE